MGHKYDCKKALDDIFSDTEALSDDLLCHLEDCPECKKQYEKAKELRSLVKKSAPDVPDIKSAVLAKIEKENITPEKAKPTRRRLPVGTLAAAAAVLVIYISANGGMLPDMINRASNEEEAGFVTSDCAVPEAVECEIFDSTESSGAGGGSNSTKLYASKTKTTAETVFDYKADGTQNDALAEIPQTCTEAQTEESFSLYSLADGAEAEDSDSNRIITGANVESETEAATEADDNYGYQLFIKLSKRFPDRISEELYKKTGDEIFISFVGEISDFETEYTEEALIEYAEKNAK